MKCRNVLILFLLFGLIFSIPAHAEPWLEYTYQYGFLAHQSAGRYVLRDGRAWVTNREGLWGQIDREGNVLLPFAWESVSDLGEGRFGVESAELGQDIIDREGRSILADKAPFSAGLWDLEYFTRFSDGLCRVEYDGRWYFIDPEGNVALEGLSSVGEDECLFAEGDFSSRRAPVIMNAYQKDYDGLWGYISTDGKLVIPCQWSDAGSFREGSAPVMNRDKLWGFVNIYGNPVTPCQWKRVGCFGDGLAMVMDETGKQGYINRKGELMIPCEWDEAGIFENGLAWVAKEGGQRGFIDAKGNLVIEVKE